MVVTHEIVNYGICSSIVISIIGYVKVCYDQYKYKSLKPKMLNGKPLDPECNIYNGTSKEMDRFKKMYYDLIDKKLECAISYTFPCKNQSLENYCSNYNEVITQDNKNRIWNMIESKSWDLPKLKDIPFDKIKDLDFCFRVTENTIEINYAPILLNEINLID